MPRVRLVVVMVTRRVKPMSTYARWTVRGIISPIHTCWVIRRRWRAHTHFSLLPLLHARVSFLGKLCRAPVALAHVAEDAEDAERDDDDAGDCYAGDDAGAKAEGFFLFVDAVVEVG